jgi:hypothetical protein
MTTTLDPKLVSPPGSGDQAEVTPGDGGPNRKISALWPGLLANSRAIGQHIVFRGTTGAFGPVFNRATDGVSVSILVRDDNPAAGNSYLGGTGSTLEIRAAADGSGRISVSNTGGSGVILTSKRPIFPGLFNQITYTRVDGLGQLYINGAFDCSAPDASNYQTVGQYVGSRATISTGVLIGAVGGLYVHNRALSDGEIELSFVRGVPPKTGLLFATESGQAGNGFFWYDVSGNELYISLESGGVEWGLVNVSLANLDLSGGVGGVSTQLAWTRFPQVIPPGTNILPGYNALLVGTVSNPDALSVPDGSILVIL